jgi:divalent metal cation (Fe/Co/Zn/Cd) transporter
VLQSFTLATDLLGDFVTLFCWRLSRKPPSERYPYGFAKFETLGTTTVSLLLIGGALGIGFHSYHLLLSALTDTASTLPSGPLQEILHNVTLHAPPVPEVVASHSHVDVVDPHAAWFALLGIVSKEWLYRITKRVADDENSPVLLANAIHHRSDAYSSLVALFAILGSWYFPKLPLDPIGGTCCCAVLMFPFLRVFPGLLVSLVILKQGIELLAGAWGDLTDAGISASTQKSLRHVLQPLIQSPSPSQLNSKSLLRVSHLRGRRAGSLIYVDLVADVSGKLTVEEAAVLEQMIAETLKHERKEVAEVKVKFNPVVV